MSLRDLLQRLRVLLLGAPPAPPPAALLLGDPARLSIPHLLHRPFPSTVLTAPSDLPPATLHLVLPPPDRTLLDAATLAAHLPPPAALIAAASSREDLLDILHALPTPLLLSPDLPNLPAVLHALTHREPLSPALLLPGATPTVHTLTRSAQRDDLTAHVRDLALAHGAHRRVAEAAASAADELIINALYNAPTGPDGAPLHRSTPRTTPIDLPPHHAATFTLTHAAPWLALTARDPFGSLPPHTLRDALLRALRAGDDQIEQKSGGAGLGFFHLLHNAHALLIHLAPGQHTEVTALLALEPSYKRFAQRGRSVVLQVFT